MKNTEKSFNQILQEAGIKIHHENGSKMNATHISFGDIKILRPRIDQLYEKVLDSFSIDLNEYDK